MAGKRRVGISEFKGKTMINIREYYEKDGESLPGKKVCVMVLLGWLSDIISMAPVQSPDRSRWRRCLRPTLTGLGSLGHFPPCRTIQYPDQAPPPYRDCVGGERPECRTT